MTPYEVVYSAFRDKVNDYDLVVLSNDDERSVLRGYLQGAISRFSRLCSAVSTYDDKNNQFSETLTDEEVDILAEIMVENWTKPKLYNSEKLKNMVSTKDYAFFSNANLIQQLRELNKEAKKNAKGLMNQYSILHSEFAKLRGTRNA